MTFILFYWMKFPIMKPELEMKIWDLESSWVRCSLVALWSCVVKTFQLHVYWVNKKKTGAKLGKKRWLIIRFLGGKLIDEDCIFVLVWYNDPILLVIKLMMDAFQQLFAPDKAVTIMLHMCPQRWASPPAHIRPHGVHLRTAPQVALNLGVTGLQNNR